MTSVYDLVGATWDQVEDSAERCRCCGHELGVHNPGAGCDACSCVYGLDGWAVDDAGSAL